MLAATLLGRSGGLTLIHASTLISADPEPGSMPDLYTAGAKDRLETIRDRIRRVTKRRVDARVVSAGVGDRLVAFAESHECDLIALGGHEHGLLDRLLRRRRIPQ